MKRIAVVVVLAVLLVVAGRWTGSAQQDDPRFTGRTDTMDAKDLSILRRSFEPGARSAWHSHDKGQLIFVESGRARTQKKGQSMKELGPGDSDRGIHFICARCGCPRLEPRRLEFSS